MPRMPSPWRQPNRPQPRPTAPGLLQGKLFSLRRIKDDVREVAAGTECGVAVEGFKDWEVRRLPASRPASLLLQARQLAPHALQHHVEKGWPLGWHASWGCGSRAAVHTGRGPACFFGPVITLPHPCPPFAGGRQDRGL